MANYVVFFAGSGQKVKSEKHIYEEWGEKLSVDGYTPIYNDGVGVNKGSNWLAKKLDLAATSGTTGRGWAIAIEESMQKITSFPEKVIVVGMSRGGVQAVMFAHCLKTAYPSAKVFIFAIDPVDGGNIQNDGSFDLRDNRNLMARMTTGLGMTRGTRGALKKKYGLDDEASKTIPDNVRFYLSVLAQFKGKTRAFWGFTPQDATLNNLTCDVPHQTYELPGDHGFGVYTGNEKGKVNTSRQARGKVTTEMFAYNLNKTGFARNFNVGFDQMKAMEYYCLIAMEDLSGSQGQGKKKSGFSFLEASRKASSKWGNSFNASPQNRWHAGRGHLVKSMQAIRGKGYFVNRRHRQIYEQVLPQIEEAISLFHFNNYFPWANIQQNYPHILPWMEKNAEFAKDREGDKKSFEDFIQLLETLG